MRECRQRSAPGPRAPREVAQREEVTESGGQTQPADSRLSREPPHLALIEAHRNPIQSWGLGGWLRGRDLNPRPLGYEPNELPDCSTPHCENTSRLRPCQIHSSAKAHVSASSGRCRNTDSKRFGLVANCTRVSFDRSAKKMGEYIQKCPNGPLADFLPASEVRRKSLAPTLRPLPRGSDRTARGMTRSG